MRRELAAGMIAGLIPLLGACGGGDRGPEGTVLTHVDTAGGVPRIRNEGRATVLELVPVLTLGSVGGLGGGAAAPDEFGDIVRVLLGPAGEVLVGDAHSDRITVFDSAGTFVRTFGRRGAGPGEIEGLQDVGWLGDTLVVMDPENARLTRLSRAGEFLGQWPFLRASGGAVRLHNAGLDELYSYALRRSTAAGGGGISRVWARFTADGSTDTIPALDTRAPAGSFATCRGDGIGFFTSAVGEVVLSRPADGGTQAHASSSVYRIAFVDAAGDTVRTLSRDVEPPPLGEDRWAEVSEDYRRWREAWRGASCEGSVERPPHARLLLGLHYDEEGQLIVEYHDGEGPALDFYDGNGIWTARVPFVERDRSVDPTFRGGRVAVVRQDSLDVQRVEVFRLRPGDGGR